MRIILIIFIFLSIKLFGQDLTYTQFYESPLNLNPALTGFIPCKFRIGGNYKNRFPEFGNAYKTRTIYIDTKISPHKLRKTWFGLGFRFNNDIAGPGSLKNTSGMATFSFNHGLIRANKFFYTLGLGLGYQSHSVNIENLYFDNQWNGTAFDSNIPSLENAFDASHGFFDVSGGFLGTFESILGNRVFWGMAFHHLNRPKDSFYGSDYRLATRTVFHMGFDKNFNNVRLRPRLMYERKQQQQELVFGLNMWMGASNGAFILGVWSRSAREISPLVGIAIKGWVVQVNYDIITGILNETTGYQGGLEFSVVKTFKCGNRIAPSGAMNKKIEPRVWDKKSNTCPAFN